MTMLLSCVVDAVAVLAIGLLATTGFRRLSGAMRHAILATAIVAALAMPVFEWFLPQLPVIRLYDAGAVISSGMTLSAGDTASGPATSGSRRAARDGIRWGRVLAIAWLLGATVTGAGLLAGLAKLARLRSRCTPVAGRWRELTDELSRQCGVRRHVALLQSADPTVLVTCGVLAPSIILPASAPGWNDDRRRVVLRHELAHIRRHDAAVQIAGEVLRIVQWINPLVWIACRRLRQESEYACDDDVLGGGVEATEYATHLLDVARHLSGRHATWASAPAIAHPSTLERRSSPCCIRTEIARP